MLPPPPPEEKKTVPRTLLSDQPTEGCDIGIQLLIPREAMLLRKFSSNNNTIIDLIYSAKDKIHIYK